MSEQSKRSVIAWLQMAWKGVEILVTVLLLVAAIAVLRSPGLRAPARVGAATAAAALPVPTMPISIDGIPTEGSASAPVVMVAFSDFQCPYCGRFARETLPTLERQFVTTGRVTIAFRHLPLGMHQYAQQAAETAACAGRQGKFWPFHNLLFQHQDKLGDAQIRDWARQAGVDEHALDRCIDHDAKGDVERDAQLANTLHVRGTPAFLIGSRNPDGTVHVVRVLSGARPVKDFQDAIESVAPVRARS